MATVTSRREALAEFARSRRESGGSGGTIRRAAALIVVLALVGTGIALWLGTFSAGPPEVRALQTLVDDEIKKLEQVTRGGATFDSVTPNFGAIMEQARAVPEPQRSVAWQQMGRLFEARETAEVQSFFRLPAAEREAEIDRRIRAEEDRRRARDTARDTARAQARDAGGPQRGGPPGGGGGPPGGSPPGGGQPGGAPTVVRMGSTEDQRNQRSKAAIDRTTPEQRAMRTEYRRVMSERRAKLGLSDRRW
jgi:hypothetical protein